MATFIMLTRLTDEGARTIRARPEHVKEVNLEIEQMGARVVSQWAALGRVRRVDLAPRRGESDAGAGVRLAPPPHGQFSRSLQVPAAFDADRAEAGYENGLLILRLPRRGGVDMGQINVSPGAPVPSD